MIPYNKQGKLIHAIIYFLKHTKYCNITKLMKMLYMLDFTHFQQTGRSVTGLDYFAWRLGPVPVEVYDQLKEKDPKQKLQEFFSVDKVAIDKEKTVTTISPLRKIKFDPLQFSDRELKIMEELSNIYRNADSETMVTITHAKGDPWDRIYEPSSPNKLIPYETALDNSTISEEEYRRRIANDRDAREIMASL